ncbi:MAG: hypothetical protein ABJB16_14235, partial [Saprospiraceae bacterium]
MPNSHTFTLSLPTMYNPAEIIQDIQERLDQVIRDYHLIIDKNKKLETENKTLATSLEEAVK